MNNYSLRVLFFVSFYAICFSNAEAYFINRTSNESLVHWSSTVSLVDIYVNPSNSQGISESIVQSIASNSVAQWNNKSRINLRKYTTSSSGQENLNEMFFSSDPSVFNGSGVVGVTQVLFKNGNGEILEADVLINNTFNFNNDINSIKYLGNVITHELGHLLGLGHGQVASSTMLYALSRGQNQVSDDDVAGLYSLYSNGNSSKGSLSGKIVGGNSLIGVFGAHVQAISLSTGNVAGATISDTDGSFVIDGLKKNDQYYIYTSPIAQIGLSSKYNSVRYDFCSSSKKYRGSFFQACGASNEGHPQAVKLNTSAVGVGKITIRCGFDVPPEYMQSKNITPALFDLQENVISGVGNSFTGYFSLQELTNGDVDYFKMDYSDIDWSTISPTVDIYVELKIINQAFYSPFKAVVGIKRDSVNYVLSPEYVQEVDGRINLDTVTRIPINRAIPSDNVFEISVKPKQISTPSTSLPFSKTDYFPSSADFEDSLTFYLVSASIVKSNGDSTFSLVSSKNDQLSDNAQCPDASNTYALTNYAVKGALVSKGKRSDEGGIACGTVDMSSGPGGGPGGFFIGLILSLFMCSLTSSIIRNNKQI